MGRPGIHLGSTATRAFPLVGPGHRGSWIDSSAQTARIGEAGGYDVHPSAMHPQRARDRSDNGYGESVKPAPLRSRQDADGRGARGRSCIPRQRAAAAAEHGADPQALATDARARARELSYAAPTHGYCMRVGISSWEGLWCRFGGDHPNVRALRDWSPIYRREAWSCAEWQSRTGTLLRGCEMAHSPGCLRCLNQPAQIWCLRLRSGMNRLA